jgi:predicted MPP superfamily phosphohydrolase
MKSFLRYTLVWISQNLSIPFWVIGHVHLSTNIYEDIHEILMSLGMNIIVAIGFYLDFKKYKNEQSTTNES